MHVWHLTRDARREPRRVSAAEEVFVHIGTWPIAPGQSVWVNCTRRAARTEPGTKRRLEARWERNEDNNSYWSVSLGSFSEGDEVEYSVHASDQNGATQGARCRFVVGPKIYLSLMWHQHQPMYRVRNRGQVDQAPERGAPVAPWVRLHALRDYYSMAALIAEQPDLRATFNFTPSLLEQLDAYVRLGASDRALDLTLADAEALGPAERQELLATFFDADWHHQIFPHPRYAELFEMRAGGRTLAPGDLRDLQMWFNLAWFGSEFRTGEVSLVTGEVCSVLRFVERGAGFARADILAMVEEQRRILRAVIPLHAQLQERGRIEVSTTPFYHPILPLLIDTNDATLDRPGAALPPRFAQPEDAAWHVEAACGAYRMHFGRDARGMWPAEGAVSQRSIPLYATAGVGWIATDRGVLARSGRWGYDVRRADVVCEPLRAGEGGASIAVFFRDTELSDAIGFRYAQFSDPELAVDDLVAQIRSRFIERFEGDDDRVLTIILDGENAWGSYPDDGRPFLRALYRRLVHLRPSIRTVTFHEWLAGNAGRGVAAHPTARLAPVHPLFTGSWIDEAGSASGVDLGTWIGEDEENRAWQLLGTARDWLAARAPNIENAPEPYHALHAAEGSDWFWWYGADQDSTQDESFDELFRRHLASVYRELGAKPPEELESPILSKAVLWTFAAPAERLASGARLAVRTNCPGILRWSVDESAWCARPVDPVGGVMAGPGHHQLSLGPFAPGARQLRFEFLCRHAQCTGHGPCCVLGIRTVELGP